MSAMAESRSRRPRRRFTDEFKQQAVRLVLDEWTRDNIALAVLGTNSIVGGQSITEIFDSNAIKGALKGYDKGSELAQIESGWNSWTEFA